jgi:hypothetical protein
MPQGSYSHIHNGNSKLTNDLRQQENRRFRCGTQQACISTVQQQQASHWQQQAQCLLLAILRPRNSSHHHQATLPVQLTMK